MPFFRRPPTRLNLPAQLSVAALGVLGWLGGSLVIAHAGFETSPRRGGTPTLVPLPEAYLVAGLMYLMSCVALLALLQDRKATGPVMAAALCAYPGLAWLGVRLLSGLLA